jgi:hypothetical protein
MNMVVQLLLLCATAAPLLTVATLWLKDVTTTHFAAQHQAQTAAWIEAFTDDRGRCGSAAPHPFLGVSLGNVGDPAKGVAAASMPSFSFLYVNGGVRRSVTLRVPDPMPILDVAPTQATHWDYMPCNETLGSNSTLPDAFTPLWTRFVAP